MAELPSPQVGSTPQWVADHLADVVRGDVVAPSRRGGQSAADAALEAFNVRGYAARRSEVWPVDRRGASGLSPYIRHGLLTLQRVWDHVASGPARDVSAFRDELLWQEYARHLYARLGVATRRSLRFDVPERTDGAYPWPREMACVDLAVGELVREGWLPNQMRMWLASQWAVRDGAGWRNGEDEFFRHLLDGSRAANRVGWQWTVGALTGKPYGFSRWQVKKRAPGLCATCPLASHCPIEEWPPEDPPDPRAYVDPRLRRGGEQAQPGATTSVVPVSTNGAPAAVDATNRRAPEAVWITAESLGDDDPALAAHSDLPVHFVWDLPLLQRLRLAPGRLVFLADALADLASRRELQVHLGDPREELVGLALAATAAPVPGWSLRAEALDISAVYPWPWLVPPHDGPVTSFTAWRRRARV